MIGASLSGTSGYYDCTDARCEERSVNFTDGDNEIKLLLLMKEAEQVFDLVSGTDKELSGIEVGCVKRGVFEAIDTNHDNSVTLQEWLAYVQVMHAERGDCGVQWIKRLLEQLQAQMEANKAAASSTGSDGNTDEREEAAVEDGQGSTSVAASADHVAKKSPWAKSRQRQAELQEKQRKLKAQQLAAAPIVSSAVAGIENEKWKIEDAEAAWLSDLQSEIDQTSLPTAVPPAIEDKKPLAVAVEASHLILTPYHDGPKVP